MANRDSQTKKTPAAAAETKRPWQQTAFTVFSIIVILSWIAALIAK